MYDPSHMALRTAQPVVAVSRIGIWVAFSVVVLIAAGCSNDRNAPKKAAGDAGQDALVSGVATYTVKGSPHVEQLELPGAWVRGHETAKLYAKVGGYVKEIGTVKPSPDSKTKEEIDIGSIVEKGTVLAVLDVPEMDDELNEKWAHIEKAKSKVEQMVAGVLQAEAALEQAMAGVEEAKAKKDEKQANLSFERLDHKRIKDLVDSGSVNEELLDAAQLKLDAAQAALRSVDAHVKTAEADVAAAKADVTKAKADKRSADADVKVAHAAFARLETLANYARIEAPFKGVISKRMVDRGAFIRPATSNSNAMPMFEITSLDRVRIVASVPNVETARIAVGQTAVFHDVGGLPGATVEGTVTRSGLALDQKSRMMRIEVHVDNPQKHSQTGKPFNLKPGMFGTLRVVMKDWNDLPVVPTSAVATDANGQHYVMAIEGGVCQRQPVEIAFNDARSVGLSGGVKIGDQIVLKGIDKLENGQKLSAN
jgi:RND family efflux transporter MFP subunit